MSPSLRRPARSLVASCALAVVAALTVTGVPDRAAAQSSADYFRDVLGDPMDFGNAEDLVTNTDEAMFVGGTNKSISGGQLHFDARGPVQFDPVWPGYASAIPHGREGAARPIDAGRYTRFVIRMNAPEGAPVGLRWFSCVKADASCQGGQAWTARGGWNTYDIRLGDDGSVPGLPVNWRGAMVGLRFVATVSGHFDVDYIRLVSDDTADVGELAGGPTIDPRPTGVADYATAAGNPWDMDSLGDVAQQVGLKPGGSVSGGRFNGCTVGTASGQFPGLVFNLPGGAIDASVYRTLTFEYGYDGAFSTRPVPGGGKIARVFWNSADGRRHPTASIALYPNEHVAQVRLDRADAQFVGVEAGKGETGAPWAGRVTAFRLNPNDTKDSACFWIGRVWLTADPGVAPSPAGEGAVPIAPTTAAPSKRPTVKTTAKATTKRKTTKRVTTKRR